ncbi:MAG: cyclic pyranopterin monophosphate synthase MoaC [Planctomycetales bacterium]|nr:cyclic pyranopterin monophosphate synthase MoaC [Planctomycetales bacterium]NIM10237.1 cyclic pyranopterin monophosphate synthase MoaC [Planctomycetales bacterium]NIN09651.1 cyclic pyranopterin monophosphate synthase MoaC [Planctomycetales bacterium]NIN78770.1 cyclic pyranopterin monophosphate synthase MoaC [Planctomycetales bacterium]NIO35948.1 cyclic pyranopterin monophosphate synthase MoaC [Planctomycetales bacterium]
MMQFSHLDEQGAGRMVDVGDKGITDRTARASGQVRMAATTLQLLQAQQLPKGNVLEIARLAGIMAAKRTSELIPLCHNLPLDSVAVDIRFVDDRTVVIEATVRTRGRTGAEMEALTAVSLTALTIYDMCKSVDKAITLDAIRLEEKTGGDSGHYVRANDPPLA